MELKEIARVAYVQQGGLVHYALLVADGRVMSPDEMREVARRLLATAEVLTDEMVAEMNWEGVTRQ